MVVYAYPSVDPFDDFLPADNEDADHFSSIEITPAKTRNTKREAPSIFNLIFDILDTVHSSIKADAKRSQSRGSHLTT